MAPEGSLGFCLILKSLLYYKFDVDYLFAVLSFSAISYQTLLTISAENCY